MKKIYSLFICLLGFCVAQAQVINGSFENWYSDTTSFSFTSYVPLDTFYYTAPVNWTCINSITMDPYLGGLQLVDSSAVSYSGSKSLYMHTDTVRVSGVGLNLVLPGFAVNGTFHLDLNSFFGISSLNPTVFKGAGVPYNQRLKSFGFYMKYAPVPNDSCLMWALLKKGNEIIADAKFSTTQSYSNFTYIEKQFTYYSCHMPDTLIILLSTSSPNLSTLGSGNTGLTGGSKIWIDSVELVPATGSFVIAPIAHSVSTFTLKNTSKTINVLAQDTDCAGNALTVSISANPLHGTARIDSVQNIVYTPTTGYAGKDTIVYSVSNGTSSSSAFVYLNIFTQSSINEISDLVHIYPNPAASLINIENESGVMFEIQIYNTNGQLVKKINTQGSKSTIDVSDLNAGIYIGKVLNAGDVLIWEKKIVILK